MGTRSLTHIKDQEGEKTLVTIYRQYDGYPTGMGNDIKAILGGRILVNGYNDPDKQCNGMGCAAAMLIAGLKDGCGNVYIYPADSHDVWEDYNYTIWPDGERFRLVVTSYDDSVLYDGPLNEFDAAAVEAQDE